MAQASGSYAFEESSTFLELELRQRVGEEMDGFQRGGMVFELDLNDPPVPSDYGRVPVSQPAKDFEVIDDDVVIISSRVFAEAKNNSTRNPEPEVRDVVEAETEVNFHRAEASTSYPIHRAKRRRLLRNQAVLNWEQYMNSEDDTKVETNEEQVLVPTEAPSFNCPICIGPMSEETSTKCGHIFCKKCIEAAIKVQHKCPTCRHKLRIKDVIRIYLPTST